MKTQRFPSLRVVLEPGFLTSFRQFLRRQVISFKKEEGGYIIGTFHSPFLFVHGFVHDKWSASDAISIRLTEAAFYEAETYAKALPTAICRVIGTWHLHPPYFGAMFSATDDESLFVDRMLTNVLDPGSATHPWIHLIVPGMNVDALKAYSLDAQLNGDFQRHEGFTVSEKCIPKGKLAGILVQPRRGSNREFLPYTPQIILRSIKLRRATGFWRICTQDTKPSRWDLLFVENFARKIRTAGANGTTGSGAIFPAQYARLTKTLGEGYARSNYCFNLKAEHSIVRPIELKVCWRIPTVTLHILDYMGERSPLSLSVSRNATLSVLPKLCQTSLGLPSTPRVFTHKHNSLTRNAVLKRVPDSIGRIDIDERTKISTLLATTETDNQTLYWDTPQRQATFVRKILSKRFDQVGYKTTTLSSKRVVLAGCGLLGSDLAFLLGLVGIGRIVLIDRAQIDWNNVYRQSMFRGSDVGAAKSSVVAQLLQEMGITAVPLELEIPCLGFSGAVAMSQSIRILDSHIDNSDMVVGAVDSFSARCVLQLLCRRRQIPFLSLAVDTIRQLQLVQASITLFPSKEGCCYMCGTTLHGQADTGACTLAPLELPRITSALAAKLIIDALTLESQTEAPRCVRVNADFSVENVPLSKPASECKLCRLGLLTAALSVEELSRKVEVFLFSDNTVMEMT